MYNFSFKDIPSNKFLFPKGTVIIAGAGPGNLKLVTIKVLCCIKEADVIIYDALVNEKLLDESKKKCKLIFAGKLSTNKSCTQEDIDHWMFENAKKNKKVLRLKSGDPSIFGRCAEEIEFLKKKKIPFKIFSGITAFQEAKKIFINEKNFDKEFCLITGHKAINTNTPKLNFKNISKVQGKVFIYMGFSQMSIIAKRLVSNGKKKETKVQIVQNISLNNQKKTVTTLNECMISKNKFGLKPPIIIIIN